MSTPTTQAAGRGHRILPLCVVLYAGAASLTTPLTGAAALAVLGPCVVVLLIAVRHRPPVAGRAGPAVRRSAVLWGALAVLAGAWELTAWLQQPAYNVTSFDHPTVSVLLDPVTQQWPLRFAAWCCWLYAGYRLVRR